MIIPPGGQVLADEPMRLPPANPAEEAELNAIMVANRWNQWRYTGRRLYSAGTVDIAGVDIGMLNARRQNVFGSWPMPGEYSSTSWPPAKPANCASVQQWPA